MNAPTDPKGAIGATKNPLHLIPTVAMTAEAAALKTGLEKYGGWNWRNEPGVAATVYVGAILRHLLAWRDGEDLDPESGISHLGHIRANCAILLDAEHVGKLVDDRPKVIREDDDNLLSDGVFIPHPPTLQIPEGLPPLPPVPEGFRCWEYRGRRWKAENVYVGLWEVGDSKWWVDGNPVGNTTGDGDTHYIEAVK